MLDLESEVMRGPGSIPTGGNILSLDFLHIVKPLMPLLVLLPTLSICEKPECKCLQNDFLTEVDDNEQCLFKTSYSKEITHDTFT